MKTTRQILGNLIPSDSDKEFLANLEKESMQRIKNKKAFAIEDAKIKKENNQITKIDL